MPELPEVETVRRTLEPHLVGRRIVSVLVRDARLRFGIDSARLRDLTEGRRVRALRRRAKYLLLDLESDSILMIHLGMTGRLGVQKPERPRQKHDHVIFALDDGRELRFNDARRFGLVEAFAASEESGHPRLAHLGIEPLAEAGAVKELIAASRGLSKPVKNFLMDGTRLVGVGNIYATEALWRARLKPTRPVGKLSKAEWRVLWRAVRATLTDAIEQGGTTLRDFVNGDGEAGYFAIRLRVYDREGESCRRCGRRIKRIVQAGRSTFYCPGCQK
jgi:formamidopyrimidine-DNA glycosylase